LTKERFNKIASVLQSDAMPIGHVNIWLETTKLAFDDLIRDQIVTKKQSYKLFTEIAHNHKREHIGITSTHRWSGRWRQSITPLDRGDGSVIALQSFLLIEYQWRSQPLTILICHLHQTTKAGRDYHRKCLIATTSVYQPDIVIGDMNCIPSELRDIGMPSLYVPVIDEISESQVKAGIPQNVTTPKGRHHGNAIQI
jgi:hypothetical protein